MATEQDGGLLLTPEEILLAFQAIRDATWLLLGSENPIQQASLQRCLKPLDVAIEKMEAQLAKVLKHRLDRPGLRKKIKEYQLELRQTINAIAKDETLSPREGNENRDIAVSHFIDQILALFPGIEEAHAQGYNDALRECSLIEPSNLEEAKKQEMGDSIQCLKNFYEKNKNATASDAISCLEFRQQTAQALEGEQ